MVEVCVMLGRIETVTHQKWRGFSIEILGPNEVPSSCHRADRVPSQLQECLPMWYRLDVEYAMTRCSKDSVLA